VLVLVQKKAIDHEERFLVYQSVRLAEECEQQVEAVVERLGRDFATHPQCQRTQRRAVPGLQEIVTGGMGAEIGGRLAEEFTEKSRLRGVGAVVNEVGEGDVRVVKSAGGVVRVDFLRKKAIEDVRERMEEKLGAGQRKFSVPPKQREVADDNRITQGNDRSRVRIRRKDIDDRADRVRKIREEVPVKKTLVGTYLEPWQGHRARFQ
jgi:hypothetical protein